DAQWKPEYENEQNVSERLFRAPDQEGLVQDVVNHIGVNFHSWVVETAVRSSAKIADAGCRGSDQHDFSLESLCPEFLHKDVSEGIVGIRVARPVIIDHHASQIIGSNLRGLPEQNAICANGTKLQHNLLIGQPEIRAHGLHIE